MDVLRVYDIVLFGATGYTGSLTLEYFAQKVEVVPSSPNAPTQGSYDKPRIRFAIAGRATSKLENLKAELIKVNPSIKDMDILYADVSNQKSIDEMVEKTKVVLSTAGPFSKYGTPVVDACVRKRTNYCDSTGETTWVREIVDKYHRETEDNGTLIVPMCGYDSIPSDLGTYLVADYFKNKLNRTCVKARTIVWTFKGAGVSGGTIASGMAVSKSGKMRSANLLSPEVKDTPNDKITANFFRYDSELKIWTFPWIMTTANSHYVRRSAMLNPSLYGNRFDYTECRRAKSFANALIGWGAMALLAVAFVFPPLKWLAAKFLPTPGTGPNKAKFKDCYAEHRVVGWSEPLGNEKPKRVIGAVKIFGDAGYGETAKMLAESALCLALQRDQITARGGVLTSATCMNGLLIERLRKAGFGFEILQADS